MPTFLKGGDPRRRSTDGLSGDDKRLSIFKTVGCQFVVEIEDFVYRMGSGGVVGSGFMCVVWSPKAQQHAARDPMHETGIRCYQVCVDPT